MSLLDALRRPSIRIPVLLVLTIAAGALLARHCNRAVQERFMATSRHLLHIEVVFRAAREAAAAGRRPDSLAELVGTPEKPGAIETLFRREYASLPEFAAPSPGSRGPRPEPRAPSIQVRGPELLWDGYCYRLWPNPANAGDFLIFAWPEVPGVGRLTSALLSAEPAKHYYAFALRFAGSAGGPTPADLGEPFAGRIPLLEGLAPETSREEFMQRLAGADGRLWAAEPMRPLPQPASP